MGGEAPQCGAVIMKRAPRRFWIVEDSEGQYDADWYLKRADARYNARKLNRYFNTRRWKIHMYERPGHGR